MRRFVHGRGTDREEATIPTFVMVANTIHRARPQYSQRDLERMEEPECEDDSDDSVDRQKVSVAPDSDKVDHSTLSGSFLVPWLTRRPYRYPSMWKWKRGRMLRVSYLLSPAEKCAVCITICIRTNPSPNGTLSLVSLKPHVVYTTHIDVPGDLHTHTR